MTGSENRTSVRSSNVVLPKTVSDCLGVYPAVAVAGKNRLRKCVSVIQRASCCDVTRR